jgi:hypothetical protein
VTGWWPINTESLLSGLNKLGKLGKSIPAKSETLRAEDDRAAVSVKDEEPVGQRTLLEINDDPIGNVPLLFFGEIPNLEYVLANSHHFSLMPACCR